MALHAGDCNGFMDNAERLGTVYSLNGLQKAINEGKLSLTGKVIYIGE